MRNARSSAMILGMLLVGIAAGCSSLMHAESGPPPDPSVLRVGITPNFPPLVYSSDKEPIGLEIDFAARLADELGRRALFVPLDWKDLIPALEDNRIDIIMSAMSITSMRKTRVAFVEPYLKVGQMALVRRVDYAKYANPFILVNTKDRVGTERGTTGDLFVQNRMANAERIYVDSPDDGARALLRNRMDVLIADAPTIWWLAANYEAEGLRGIFEPLTEEYLAWAVSRDNPVLLDEVNRVLSQWRDDGTLETLLKRWIP